MLFNVHASQLPSPLEVRPHITPALYSPYLPPYLAPCAFLSPYPNHPPLRPVHPRALPIPPTPLPSKQTSWPAFAAAVKQLCDRETPVWNPATRRVQVVHVCMRMRMCMCVCPCHTPLNLDCGYLDSFRYGLSSCAFLVSS